MNDGQVALQRCSRFRAQCARRRGAHARGLREDGARPAARSGARMKPSIDSLKLRLAAIARDEQMDVEASEREDGVDVSPAVQAARLEELARSLAPAALDALERTPGYAVWALRLAPFVAGDDSRARAARWLAHADADIRYWAARVYAGTHA